ADQRLLLRGVGALLGLVQLGSGRRRAGRLRRTRGLGLGGALAAFSAASGAGRLLVQARVEQLLRLEIIQGPQLRSEAARPTATASTGHRPIDARALREGRFLSLAHLTPMPSASRSAR